MAKTTKTDAGALERFLERLADGLAVKHAAAAAGLGRSTVYGLRETDEAFAKGWADAIEDSTQELEQEGWRRAKDGVDRPVFHQGEIVGSITEYSDTLLIFLLKSRRPGTYRDHYKHEFVGKGDGPIVVQAEVDASRVLGDLVELGIISRGAGSASDPEAD